MGVLDIFLTALALTGLALVFLWLMYHWDNRQVIRRLPPGEVLNAVREALDRLSKAELRLDVLSDVAETVTEFLSQKRSTPETRLVVEDLLLSAAQGVLPGNQFPRIRVLSLNPQTGRLEGFQSFVPAECPPFRGSTFAPGEGAVGTCYQSRSAIVVDNADDSDLFANEDGAGRLYKSVVCVPIPATGSQPVGVLNLDAPVEGYFTEEHMEFLKTICNFLGLVLRAERSDD